MAHNENFRVRGPEKLKRRWADNCEARRISQNEAHLALIEWFLAQDDIVQGMILGQIRAADDLVELIFRRARKK